MNNLENMNTEPLSQEDVTKLYNECETEQQAIEVMDRFTEQLEEMVNTIVAADPGNKELSDKTNLAKEATYALALYKSENDYLYQKGVDIINEICELADQNGYQDLVNSIEKNFV